MLISIPIFLKSLGTRMPGLHHENKTNINNNVELCP